MNPPDEMTPNQALHALVAGMRDAAEREAAWQRRAEQAEARERSAVEDARARTLDLQSASVAASRDLAVATLAAALLARHLEDSGSGAVREARRALAQREGTP
jgi:hypothetical protein